MRTIRTISIVTLVFCALSGAGLAQGTFAGPRRGGDAGAGLAEIFGKDKSFSAVAHTTIKGAGGNDMQIEMSYAVLEGKVRTEMDMTKAQGGMMSPQAAAMMKQMGMDKSITIMLPEKHKGYVVFPGMKAYCDLPMGASSSSTESNTPPKTVKTEVGKETLDGHPCVKYKVVVTPEGGTPVTMFVWQATDLKEYPIQTEVDAGNGGVVTTRFQDINQTKPSASLFEPPSDYKHYSNQQEMMMNAMGAMGGAPGGRSTTPIPPRGGQQAE